ncbi:FdhF/YdeP family oxidoreductase [Enterobacter sp. R1(2018)]|uniref:FdhF/YdeP family oxidoreductase n=1 Tax=Enterobacter sp. R1(2018) TaxID=2447891 RepID=UPI000EB55B08|nr:FdhF/YdeP family oxidoreductase [Enterobacter sp. R1(2018)]RKQ38158.1 CbbBc protein [Enterobacter sp. R1(2018)]
MKQNAEGIRDYHGAAGGWGAVKAVAQAVRGQKTLRRGVIAIFRMNQVKGFDCPGCAWPDPEHRSPMELCENGVKAVSWEATTKKVTPEFLAAHPVSELWDWSDFRLEDEGRLTHPVKYDAQSDTYQPISWEKALQEIGERLRDYNDPDSVEFYTSGRASNEAAFLYQLFAREYGTNNFPDCSNMCHGPTSIGLPQSIGIGKGTVALEDFEHCELVICVGHNPATNHPRMLSTLREVALRGAKIVTINPLRERGLEKFSFPQSPVDMLTNGSTQLSSALYNVRVGGDIALIKGIMKLLLEHQLAAEMHGKPDVIDKAFIAEHTTGFRELAEDLAQTTWQSIIASSGLSFQQIGELTHCYETARATIISYGLGITQHENGSENIQQLANLLLLKGNMGRKGAGICPLRGHSNVQGDRSVGINEAPSEAFLQALESRFGFRAPRKHGHSAVESVRAIRDGHSKALICLGGNMAVAMPDPLVTFPAMRGLDLAVHMATKLNRSHLLVARHSYILPVLGRTERDIQTSGVQSVTVEDSMSMVHASCGSLKPASPHLRSEPAIIAGLAMATLPHSKVNWQAMMDDYRLIRDAIEDVVPGFTDYNQRIEQPGGFRMWNGASRRIWLTDSEKANFLVCQLKADAESPLPENTLMLTTMRSHDQYNTTIYGMNDRYRGITGRRDVMFISEMQAKSLGLSAGDIVNLKAVGREGIRHDRMLAGLTVVIHEMAAGAVGAYYPEANILIDLDHHDRQSATPAYKSAPVIVEAVTRRLKLS